MLHRICPAVIIVLMFCHVLVLVDSLSAAQWQGAVSQAGGIPEILNPAEPFEADQTVKPDEVWRLGGEEDESEHMMGWVTDVQIDADGNFYLLDSSLSVIHVHAPDGSYLRHIGGPGEGPGEFRNAMDFMLMPGGVLGVTQILPAKVVTLDTEGVPGAYFATCGGDRGMGMIDRAESAGDFIVIGSGCSSPAAGGMRYALEFVDRQGTPTATLCEDLEPSEDGNINLTTDHPYEFTRYWAMRADGRVFVAPHDDAYLIEVYGPDGGLERIIKRKYETLRRSDEDLAADRRLQEQMREQFGDMIQFASREFERDINRMYARPDGGLWVFSSESDRDTKAGALGPFEIFDAEGRFVRRATLQVDYNPEKDDYLVVGDHLLILKQAQVRPASSSSSSSGGMMSMVVIAGGGGDDEEEDDPTPPSVVCYRLR